MPQNKVFLEDETTMAESLTYPYEVNYSLSHYIKFILDFSLFYLQYLYYFLIYLYGDLKQFLFIIFNDYF
jgi:hypothetical protein